MLVDGFPITDPTTGSVQLGQFSTIGVSRIEVVESGSSTLYGSSAAGGVINIITSVPRGVYLEGSAGSYGDRDARAGVGNQYVGFTYERHVATGDYPYPTFPYSPATTFPGGVRGYAYGDQSAGRLSFAAPVGGFIVRGSAYASAVDIGVPGSLAYPLTTATQDTSYHSGLLEVERDFANSKLTLSLVGSDTRLAYNDPVQNDGESDVYTGRSQISLKDVISGKSLDAVAGVQPLPCARRVRLPIDAAIRRPAHSTLGNRCRAVAGGGVPSARRVSIRRGALRRGPARRKRLARGEHRRAVVRRHHQLRPHAVLGERR